MAKSSSPNTETILKSCLLMNISTTEYEEAKELPLNQCQVIAAKSILEAPDRDLLKIDTSWLRKSNNSEKPGEILIDKLYKGHYKAKDFRLWLQIAKEAKLITTYYEPQAKVAVLIANDKYMHMRKLAAPSNDCVKLKFYLQKLGFIVVMIRNCLSKDIKVTLETVFAEVPEKSYCLIYCAGHGFELCDTLCILDTSSPLTNVTTEHCVTESYIIQTVQKCKPELCVLCLDMCRVRMERETHPKLYESILSEQSFDKNFNSISNLYISFSTSSDTAANEEVYLKNPENSYYSQKTGESVKIKHTSSPYSHLFCKHLWHDMDVSTFIDTLHEDVPKLYPSQIPTKIQRGTDKRSLYDCTSGNMVSLYKKLKEYCKTADAQLDKVKYGEYKEIGIFSPERNHLNVVFLDSKNTVARIIQKC